MAGFNIKHWFADGAFRTIIRNSAWLGSSNVVSALLGLLALSCAGKGMTPAMFGVRHCCKVSDEAAFCLIQRPYISKTL
ncbi:hypothetical protein ACSJH7_12370, partial [Escherichia coli]